jgi:Xaa-Pro aminopeptidase
MVMCIEPFVFAQGVHVEDTILVTEKGCKVLSSYKEFEELPIVGK